MYELSLISTFVVIVVVNLSLSLSLLQMAFKMLQKYWLYVMAQTYLKLLLQNLLAQVNDKHVRATMVGSSNSEDI